ncbi:hypothetical protein GDO78_013109 [Eleutherodactylus coqui]|uniref:Uncharacterized protein n=1 Tax=Eleutherodactylus coqui TaxID=57060 RepID=A0A8J6F087_ELECQ|nr:hypothetical protein GDO78_013109 [Eleutherodactylus coqui]
MNGLNVHFVLYSCMHISVMSVFAVSQKSIFLSFIPFYPVCKTQDNKYHSVFPLKLGEIVCTLQSRENELVKLTGK